jgi:CheY-like chemotaxis protein
MVAEDDAVNRTVVSKMLGEFDVDLRVVTDGAEVARGRRGRRL